MDLRTKRFLKKTRIQVKPVHDTVQLTIGNWGLDLPYDVAFELAVSLRIAAKKCKREMGDNSRILRVRGVLTDANPYPKKGRSQIVNGNGLTR